MRTLVSIHLSLVLCCAPLATAAERTETGSGERTLPLIAHVYFQNAQNVRIGEALLRETPNGVLVTLDLRELPPGEHALHVHETGKCAPPFESAGGHFNPTHKHHGFVVPQGPHAGDLPNLFVLQNGRVRAELLARDTTLVPGKPGSIVDQDGAALVIHAKGDDYSTDPAGASGERIACGVVEEPVRAAKGGIVPRPWERAGSAKSGVGQR